MNFLNLIMQSIFLHIFGEPHIDQKPAKMRTYFLLSHRRQIPPYFKRMIPTNHLLVYIFQQLNFRSPAKHTNIVPNLHHFMQLADLLDSWSTVGDLCGSEGVEIFVEFLCCVVLE